MLRVDTQLFRGVHYELSTYDKDGNEWLVHSLKKAEVGAQVGLDFDPEAIHIMRLNETEEEFDARIEAYRMKIKSKPKRYPIFTMDCALRYCTDWAHFVLFNA